MFATVLNYPLLPEIVLATLACMVLLVDLYLPKQHQDWVYRLSQFTLAVTALIAIQLWGRPEAVLFSGHFISDGLAVVLKLAVLLLSFFSFAYVQPYFKSAGKVVSEYYLLCLFSILGMFVLISAGSMLTLYLGLELLALPLYALVAIMRQYSTSSEAAIKYFVMGALASGMLLFGISLVYGATGSLTLVGLPMVMGIEAPSLLLTLGIIFMVIGIAFKFGAVPFHMWVPDVYSGSPNPVVLFLSSAPKVAAFGLMIRILWDQFGALYASWEMYMTIMAVLSLIIGNIVAIAQTNIKRMLAYSTIGHVGFIFLAVSVNDMASAMFYVLAYALMALAAFGVLTAMSTEGQEVTLLEDIKGLSKRNRLTAFLMMLVMFSLAGVPPTVGFYAKLTVLAGVLQNGHFILAGIAVFTSVIAAFYYLRVVWLMYFEQPQEGAASYPVPTASSLLLTINAGATWALGLAPAGLMGLCVFLCA